MTKKLPELQNRNCKSCGSDLTGRIRSTLFCNRICTWEFHNRKNKISKQCFYCDSKYLPYRKNQKYCSIKCGVKSNAIKNEGTLKQNSHDRRARIRDTRSTERFTREQVFTRDNWICQLCFTPIDFRQAGRGAFAPSIDHKIPISRGGTHTFDNVWSAHLGCNARKSNKEDENFLCGPPQRSAA